MDRRRVERWRRWLGMAVLLAVMPKCLACILAWFGVALALGPEICG